MQRLETVYRAKSEEETRKILIINDILVYETRSDTRVIILVHGFRTYDKWQYFTKIIYG